MFNDRKRFYYNLLTIATRKKNNYCQNSIIKIAGSNNDYKKVRLTTISQYVQTTSSEFQMRVYTDMTKETEEKYVGVEFYKSHNELFLSQVLVTGQVHRFYFTSKRQG